MTSLKTNAKHRIRSALRMTGVGRATRFFRRDQALVLAYHNVIPDGMGPIGEHSLHIELSRFTAQLEALSKTHRVVPLSDIVHRTDSGRGGPRVAITFDDAYAGAIELGASVLARMGLPATMFVAPGALGGQAFWWDRYARPRDGYLPEVLRNEVLALGVPDQDKVEVLAEGAGVGPRVLPTEAHTATVAAVKRYSAVPGLELAPHTWSHANLTALEPSEVQEELRRSLRWVQEHGSSHGPWASYPYGLYSSAVEEAARAIGLEAGFRLTGHWIARAATNRFGLSRVNVHSMVDENAFRLRIDGVGLGPRS